MNADSQLPLVSIIINNYNYSCYLKEAIDSALNQTYSRTEVIVVDDGSTDDSPQVIAQYGSQIISIIKKNGGQASAFNAGFAASQGDIIFFLDSDDIFYANKVQEICNILLSKMVENSYVMLYHLLECIDKNGVPLGQKLPKSPYNLPANLYNYTCQYRFFPYAASPTSGIAMSRALAEQIFPIPEQGVLTSADEFIVRPALLIGEVYGVDQVLAKYRLHNANNWYGKSKVKNKEFIFKIESFLNSKLKEHNKKPVVSYFDSMDARNYYLLNGSSKDLFMLLLKIPTWGINKKTVKFGLKTALLAINLSFKQART
ncbi:glycosyltransferase [Gloeocapsopsis sp. IPPAS B-1203]|uniref:glycosyltransferase family 2 protein n=1 Tax=Gloeocapsopsis sp. IPPAS B-1203 TaxID=2049454 RepID=UPI000C196244|nr:glycosyltransferase [Gloeocapsopsis sp. IPPAS B-1203]PIG94475.1 glucosyl transferase [Gloeocapsopsis sp. IPPAS B-1203]